MFTIITRQYEKFSIAQCKNYPFPQSDFYVEAVNSLLVSTAEYVKFISDKLSTTWSLSDPKIFVEDTHPSRIKINADINRYLIVRATTFDYLVNLKNKFSDFYKCFFIADHFDSPTWPYSKQETEEIQSWDNWYLIGPIYRKVSPEAIKRMKAKYRWSEDKPIFIFSMGGGGQQKAADDVSIFFEKAHDICYRILTKYKKARLLFVKGPLFPSGLEIPKEMEAVDSEKEMPALIALAKGAVIRPGFNTIWECISARIPFYIIEGTTFVEPIQLRLAQLQMHGLYSQDLLFDNNAYVAFIDSCTQVTNRWNGQPSDLFYDLISDNKMNELSDESELRPIKSDTHLS